MGRDELDSVLDQVLSEDARERRNAAKRLGELGRPEAISELVNLYQNDPEPEVRQTAHDALVKFRRMEQKLIGLDDDDESTASSTDWSSILTKVRLGLAITLGVTLFVNAIFFVGGILPKPEPPSPTAAPLTERPVLVEQLTKRLSDAKTEAADLRKSYAIVQGTGIGGVKQEQCQKFSSSTVNKVDLSQIDFATYPDIRSVNDLINIPSLKLLKARNYYIYLCSVKDQNQFNEAVKSPNSPAEYISLIDETINKELPAADSALKNAIEHPAPTIAPTSTPVPTATPTVPTSTPTPIFTATPTPLPATATLEATVTPVTPTLPAAPQTYNFSGLGLESSLAYTYKITGTSSGVLSNNKTFNGSALITVKHQTTPTAVQIDFNISEGNPSLTFFKTAAGGFYVQGTSTFVITDNILYETGTVIEAAKFNGRCRATHVTQSMLDKAESYKPNISPSTSLTLKEAGVDVNGTTTNHYTGKQVLGTKQELMELIDVYVSVAKNIPVKVVTTLSLNPDQGAAAARAAGLSVLNVTLTYELTSQGEVSIVKPVICENVPVR